MESPGQYLKREREIRGVNLGSVAAATRVPLKLLEAIESDNFAAQHPTFIKGFIRSYCKHLGLDENDAVLRYEIFMKEHPGNLDITLSEDMGEPGDETPVAIADGHGANGKRNILILVVVGVLAIILFYLFSSVFSERKSPVDVGSGSAIETVPPVAVSNEATDVASDTVSKETGTASTSTQDATLNQAESLVPGDAAERGAGGQEAAGRVESGVLTGPQGGVSITDSMVGELSNYILTVKATEEVWVETWVDGAKPVDVILKPGESLERRASQGVFLVIGNAGGVEINFDGELIELFGQSGKVVRLKLPAGYEFDVPPPVRKPAIKRPVEALKPHIEQPATASPAAVTEKVPAPL